MPAVYELQEYIRMVECYYMSNCSARAAVAFYRERYPNAPRFPSKNVIQTAVRKFQECGNVMGPKLDYACGPTVQEQEDILEAAEEDPEASTREIGRQLGLSHTKVWKVLNEDRQHPYHYTRVHVLREEDKPIRLQWCINMQARIRQQEDFLDFLLFSDECKFGETGTFNQHNCHYWAHENPHLLVPIKAAQERWSRMKWAGLINNELVIMPLSFAKCSN